MLPSYAQREMFLFLVPLQKVVIQYSVRNVQLVWSEKTDRTGFAGIMVNDMNGLEKFYNKQFPGMTPE